MHLELRHLRSLRAIHDQGGLARAAEVLNLTQSALSHQIKALEEQAGVELFLRKTKPLRLSAAGMRLLHTAAQVLPLIDAAEAEFRAVELGRAGRLHVALECHHCYDWLLPVLDQFRRAWPEVDLDIRSSLALKALPALQRGQVDMAISSDPEEISGVTFQPLFDYAPAMVVAANWVADCLFRLIFCRGLSKPGPENRSVLFFAFPRSIICAHEIRLPRLRDRQRG